VLLISLSGAAVSYLFMAFAPQLGMLVIGRAIAELTSVNISVATAYTTDISPEDIDLAAEAGHVLRLDIDRLRRGKNRYPVTLPRTRVVEQLKCWHICAANSLEQEHVAGRRIPVTAGYRRSRIRDLTN